MTPSGTSIVGSTVTTSSGSLHGELTDGVAVFRGVPYAASTAGANRFRPPQRRESPDLDVDCSRFGPAAPQLPELGRGPSSTARTVSDSTFGRPQLANMGPDR